MTQSLTVKPRDPAAVLREQLPDVRGAAARAMEAECWIDGPQTRAFEKIFAHWLGVGHAVGTGSGASALQIALAAAGVSRGSLVVADGLVEAATVAAVSRLGARLSLVDVEPGTLTMDPAALEAALAPGGSAEGADVVLATHRFGHPAAMTALVEAGHARGAKVIEEAAQALGALLDGVRVGSLADAAAFDLSPGRGQGGVGSAGMVTTNDAGLAALARALTGVGGEAVSGADPTPPVGFDCPMGEVEAAVLGALLPRWDSAILRRQSIALRYDMAMSGFGLKPPVERSSATHTYTAYPVRFPNGPAAAKVLADAGIDTAWSPVPALVNRPGWVTALPGCKEALANVLLLPIYPQMPADDQRKVMEALPKAVA